MYTRTMNATDALRTRTCLFVVECVAEDGYRFWSASMPEAEVNQYIDGMASIDYGLSDVDHTGPCHGFCSNPIGN